MTGKIVNKEQLEFVGAGRHGEVYKLDEHRCVKFYKKRKYLRRELFALRRGQGERFFPRLYYHGHNYIVREYIQGTPLNKYLRIHKLTRDIAGQLVELLEAFRRSRFRRADTRLSHIIVTPEGNLKVIDPVNSMKKSLPFPRKLLKGLRRRGMEQPFLRYVARNYPEVFSQWWKYLPGWGGGGGGHGGASPG